MKRTVRTAAALLGLILLLPAAGGCLKIEHIDLQEVNGPETDPQGTNAPVPDAPGPDTPETEAPAPDPGPDMPEFTLDELYEKNDIRVLLASHDSVTVTRSPGSDSVGVNSFWMMDGELVYYYVNTVTYDGWDGEPMTGVYQGGIYRGLEFEVHPDEPVTVNLWISPDAEENGFVPADAEGFISGFLPGYVTGEPVLTASDEKTFTVQISELAADEGGAEVECVNTLTLDRETLAVQAMEWEYDMYGETYSDSFTVTYDGERLGMDILEDWEGTRTVSVELITEAGTDSRALVLPGLWRMNIWTWSSWFVSDEFAVPGSDSCTVAPGGGSVTLWVRDEANMPVDTPEGEGWDALGFTRDALIEANRITNLTVKYGTVTVSETAEYGDGKTSFFRYGEPVVMYNTFTSFFDDGTPVETAYGSAAIGDLDFTVTPAGVLASAIPGTELPDPDYLKMYSNAEGEFYRNDLYIAGAVLEGDVTDVSRENGTVTFLVESAYLMGDRNLIYFYTVDEESLRLLSYGEYEGEWSCSVAVGETIPFEEEFARAFADTRELRYHTRLAGEEREYLYIVPASWSFSLTVYGEGASFTSDAAGLSPVENLVPPDGQSYEIWVSDAVG